MKILVTGGAGFIGSHVVDAYIDAGHDVVVIDDLSTGKRENLNKKARFYDADITNEEELESIFIIEKPDIVNHHAAQVDVNYSITHPKEDAEINVVGTINLLKLSAEHGVKRFIFASSAAVYGGHEPGEKGLKEDLPPLPLSPYGISKHAAEEYVKAYASLCGMNYIIFRYPNVYGPRQKSGDGGVIVIFTQHMTNGEDVTIFGNGHQTRDFLFVKDAARANVTALEAGNGTLNIGTGSATSINDLFSMLKEKMKYQKNALYAPERKGEVKHSKLDCTKAKSELWWTAETNLQDELKKTIHTGK